MTSSERPTVQAGLDPIGDLVLTVRGDTGGAARDYELPLAVALDQASVVLGLDRDEGLRRAQADSYPVPVIDLGAGGFRVGTAHLVRAAGIDAVRESLRVEG